MTKERQRAIESIHFCIYIIKKTKQTNKQNPPTEYNINEEYCHDELGLVFDNESQAWESMVMILNVNDWYFKFNRKCS